MIELSNVTFAYAGASVPVLRDVSISIPEGELALVVGPTGSGKSTLLQALNGLVPHFTGGTMSGTVTVAGRSTRDLPPRELADVVGYVQQDPQRGFVTDVVEDELAYTMESLAIPPDVMRRRVEETLDLLGITELRDRPLRTLSGGQRQRVAVGAVLTAHPRILVLDEPTSALDPQAGEEVLAAIQRLVHDLGMTVVLSEHRLERVVQYADRVLLLPGDGSLADYADPSAAMAVAPVFPPVVELGRWAGWDPLPLSVRDARRRAAALAGRLADHPPQLAGDPASPGIPVADVARVSLAYPSVRALREATFTVSSGEVVALMGRNGSGKSTALGVLSGQLSPDSGTASVAQTDPTTLSGSRLLATVCLVPQEPADLLWAESVAAECAAADRDAGVPDGTAAAVLADLAAGVDPQAHPNDLSEGTRLALVLAIMLAGRPRLLLLDEPTRGLDYSAKRRLARVLRERAAAGTAVVLATHDVELVAETCGRMVMLADGEVVLDTDARNGATSSPVFAPQVAKIVAPARYLTVAEVAAALPDGIDA